MIVIVLIVVVAFDAVVVAVAAAAVAFVTVVFGLLLLLLRSCSSDDSLLQNDFHVIVGISFLVFCYSWCCHGVDDDDDDDDGRWHPDGSTISFCVSPLVCSCSPAFILSHHLVFDGFC